MNFFKNFRAIPNVYTIGAALRADKSLTRQHLSEFRMLEVECAFMDSVHSLCDLIEAYLNFIIEGTLANEENYLDLEISKSLRDLCKVSQI